MKVEKNNDRSRSSGVYIVVVLVVVVVIAVSGVFSLANELTVRISCVCIRPMLKIHQKI